MPLETKRIDFADERDRIKAEMEDTAEEQVEWATSDGSNADYLRQLQARGTRLNDYREILAWAQEAWDVDGITIAGLNVGEMNRVEDFIQDNQGVRERDAFVAIGTHEAPYVAHDPDAITDEAYAETVGNVVDNVPMPFVQWAEERVGDLSHLESDMGNEYTKLLLAERQAATDGSG